MRINRYEHGSFCAAVGAWVYTHKLDTVPPIAILSEETSYFVRSDRFFRNKKNVGRECPPTVC